MNKMKLLHKIGIGFIDKMILAFALVIVYLSVAPTTQMEFIAADATMILIIVFASYLITILVVNLLTLSVRTEDRYTKLAVGILSAGFVLWLYPVLLWGLLFLFGLSVSADVETVLIWTMVIRTFARIYLNRLWGSE